MKITTFNPLIVTRDPENAIRLFEEMGFEKRHTKKGIGETGITDVRMKNADGFCVDVAQGSGEWTMIRINVDDYDEAIAFLTAHGFRKPRHETAGNKVDTGTSVFTIMVAPSGFIVAVSQHIRDQD